MIDAKEMKRVVKFMRANGVRSLKTDSLSIELGDVPHAKDIVPRGTAAASNDEDDEIKHRVDEFTSIMKLGDEELVDRLFPMPQDEEGDAE